MRVTSVRQENNKRSTGVLKAGLIGAGAGTLVRNFAPLTTEEHNFFFNDSAKKAIQDEVRKVRINETAKIAEDFAANKINISKEAYDVFEKSTSAVVDEPKKAMDIVANSADAIKTGFKSLVKRVDAVGAAKEHIEVSNIKSAAKTARPLGYFAAAGAFVAMTGQLIIDAFNQAAPKSEPIKQESDDSLTMADILLQGLGSNTEMLFLATESERK